MLKPLSLLRKQLKQNPRLLPQQADATLDFHTAGHLSGSEPPNRDVPSDVETAHTRWDELPAAHIQASTARTDTARWRHDLTSCSVRRVHSRAKSPQNLQSTPKSLLLKPRAKEDISKAASARPSTLRQDGRPLPAGVHTQHHSAKPIGFVTTATKAFRDLLEAASFGFLGDRAVTTVCRPKAKSS